MGEKPTGAWAGYLIFGLFMLFLVVLDAQAAYNHEWSNVAGISVFALALAIVPTGGYKWLRRSLRSNRP
jgi:hypothetical protein